MIRTRPMISFTSQFAGTCLLVPALCMRCLGGDISSWAVPTDGIWDVRSNWIDERRPNANRSALFSLNSAYTVSTSRNEELQSLLIENQEVTIDLVGGSYIRMFDNSLNNGLIRVHSDSEDVPRWLSFVGEVSLSGHGSIELAHPLAEIRLSSFSTLTHGPTHTILGCGKLIGEILNQGTIKADRAPGIVLSAQTEFDEALLNDGILEATGEGSIDATGFGINQSSAGTVRAIGASSAVLLGSQSIVGGAMESVAEGKFYLEDEGWISGVYIDSSVHLITTGSTGMSQSTLDNAELEIHGTKSGIFRIAGDNMFSGDGEVILNSDSIFTSVSMDNDLIWPSGWTVSGHGSFNPPNIVNGDIRGNIPGQTLEIHSPIHALNGTLSADGGNAILSGSISGGNGSIISDGPGSIMTLYAPHLIGDDGLSLQSINGGMFEVTQSLTLTEMTLSASLYSGNGTEVTCHGNLQNAGTIILDRAYMEMRQLATVAGPGVIRLLEGEINFDSSSIGAQQVIDGHGLIEGSGFNVHAGTIDANTPNSALYLKGRLTNEGAVRASNGGNLILEGYLEQKGTGHVIAEGAGSKISFGDKNPSVLNLVIGGSISSSNGVPASIGTNYEFYDVTLNIDIEADEYYFIQLIDKCELNGTIDFTKSGSQGGVVSIHSPPELDGVATIILSTDVDQRSRVMGGSVNEPLNLGSGVTITGPGSISGPAILNGTLAPGLNGIGRMYCSSSFILSESSLFEVEVSETESDWIDGFRDVTINGEIALSYTDGFNPKGYWVHPVIIAPEVVNGEVSLNGPPTPAGFVYRYLNTGTELMVGQVQTADMNMDGATNFFDVGVFIGFFQTADPRADLNKDGSVNFFDVSIFIQSFI